MKPGFPRKIDRLRHLWEPALILLVGLLAYSNSLQGPFVLDDIYAIVRNSDIHSFAGQQFHTPRYLAYQSFALNYQLGGVEVFGYHLVNLLIHLLTALLVYLLLRLTFRTPYFAAQADRDSGTGALMGERMIPLVVALLFVVHPLQTQAVTYVVQRMTSMAALFYLSALVLYLLARLRAVAGEGRRWMPVLLLVAATLAAVAAMKTKEIAFTLPLAIALYELFFFSGSWKKRLLWLLPLLATLPIVPLSVVAMQQSLAAAADGGGAGADTELFSAGELDRLTYLLTQFRVIVTYLRLLVLPVNQNLDHEYPIYTSFLTPPVFLSFLLLSGLAGVAVCLYFRSARPLVTEPGFPVANPARHVPTPGLLRLISFGICWFFLTLAVESSVVPIVDVIAEHRVYLPGVGFFLGAVALIVLLLQRVSSLLVHRLVMTAALVLILVLGYATWQRNQIWSDDLRLWHDVIAKSPGKARPYNDIGAILIGKQRFEEAIDYLSRSVELDPQYPYAYSNLGLALIMSNRSAEAIPLLKKAIGLHLRFEQAYINLAVAFNQSRQFQQTVTLLEGNSSWINERVELHYHLGVAYYFLGNRAATLAKLQIVEQSGNEQLAQDLRRLLAGR